jgi:hypothetical protein
MSSSAVNNSSGNSIDMNSSSRLASELISFQARLKAQHWGTKSYSRHKITEKLIKQTVPLSDKLIELYIAVEDFKTSVRSKIGNNISHNNSRRSSHNVQRQYPPTPLRLEVHVNETVNEDDSLNSRAIMTASSSSLSTLEQMLVDLQKFLAEGEIGKTIDGNKALASTRDELAEALTRGLYLCRMKP